MQIEIRAIKIYYQKGFWAEVFFDTNISSMIKGEEFLILKCNIPKDHLGFLRHYFYDINIEELNFPEG